MKTKLTIIAILFFIVNVNAQTEKLKRFDIDASINFWTPSSSHLKAVNSITQYQIGDNYYNSGGISGYGTSVAPIINITYRLKNTLGLSLGFYPVISDNELNIQKTDTTFSNFENTAAIMNFTLGINGKISTVSVLNFYYGFGVNFVPNYDFMIHVSTESGTPSDLEANDLAVGFYFNSGINVKLYKFLYFRTGIKYSFVPAELEYTNSDGVKYNEKTNIGGIGLHAGFSVSF